MFILVIGAGSSGKSAFAEDLTISFGCAQSFYIAAMRDDGEESAARIRRHRKLRRGKGFTTVCRSFDMEKISLKVTGSADGKIAALLESATCLLANEMFREEEDGREGGAGGYLPSEEACSKVLAGIDTLLKECDNLVVVCDDIFEEAAVYSPLVEEYRRSAAMLNRRMAMMADEVIEVVCGIPIMIKERVRG